MAEQDLDLPDTYRELIFLSPIMEKDVLLDDDFVDGWRGRPILVLHGEDDRRIPIEYVRERVRALECASIDIDSVYFPGEDHFLVSSQWDEIGGAIGDWIGKNN